MALSLSLSETNIGIPVADTYARITLLQCTSTECFVHVSHYANADARQAEAVPVYNAVLVARFEELQSGIDPLAIAYTWLKTQPEYADAVDC